MSVYDKLGVRTLINARGCITDLGGSIMAPEVLKAMVDAAPYFLSIAELNRQVGKTVARITGAEAGYVTAGGSAGMLLATAAVMTGKDPARIRQLPDTTGMKNEVIVHRSQRNSYDGVIPVAGARLVEIGHAYRTLPGEIEAAIGERTAAICYTVHPFLRRGFLSLPEVIEIAHARSLPVYVDAASSLPPAGNLQKFIAMGADLVIYSGGKAIMGPQSTGILCGRKDLVEAAAMNGSPNHAVGRPAKVSKEEMVGLAVALELYEQRDHAADQARWRRQATHVVEAVAALGLPGVEPALVYDEDEDQLPEAHIIIRDRAIGLSARRIDQALFDGEPRIVSGLPLSARTVIINPHMLQDGEEEVVARRLVEVLTALATSAAKS
jgi:L-seryl-tRNA(Ser) seleniumtransferase